MVKLSGLNKVNKEGKILIVDGHGLAFRAFYAVPPLSAPDGTPTNAIHGFMNMLSKIEDETSPSSCLVAFDAPGPTFRHELYKEYKAQRKPTPPEFKPQVPLLMELLAALGYQVVSDPRKVEADDVIASSALAAAGSGKEALIVTSDKDLFQVLGPGIKILRPLKGITTLKTYDEAAFAEEFGFPPKSMADYLALLGDASDNVPGVPGVGEKTALQLVREFGTIGRLYEALEGRPASIKPGLAEKLAAGRESALQSLELIRLKLDLSVEFREPQPNIEDALALCKRLGMAKLTEKLKKFSEKSPTPTPCGGTPFIEGGRNDVSLKPPSTKEVDAAGGRRLGLRPAESDTKQLLQPAPVQAAAAEAFELGAAAHTDTGSLLDSGELAVYLKHSGSGKYPPEIGSCELQLADPSGRCAVIQGLDITSDIWDRLNGKKLVVNDYKELLASIGSGQALGQCEVWDLKTAHYLLHPDAASHSIEAVYPQDNNNNNHHNHNNKPSVLSLWRASRELGLELRRYERLPEVMTRIDLPLIPALVDMERAGIRLSAKTFITLQRELEERLSAIEKQIGEAAGEEINLNSPKQVAWLLFERLGFPSGAKTKGKTGYSTSASVLETLADLGLPGSEVPRLMLEHRELSKMLSGFVVPLQKSANAGGGVVHTTFEAAYTGTGRLSSRDPNLQNLPAFGQWSRRIKEGLVPSAPGRIFVAADYSQIELRILAHFSGEERLQEAFQKGGRDVHRETASWVFATPPEDVTPELRRVAKMINFGLLYGMSSFGLADRLGISRAEAGDIIKRYFDALPGVKRYLDESAEEAKERGYTQTLFGRIRPIAEAMNEARDRNGLKRVAVNTPIQGTAADIARKAMIDFASRFAQGRDVRDGVRLLLQIHDSLVCECPEERVEEIGEALSEVMRSAVALAVPLEVELKTGRSLADV